MTGRDVTGYRSVNFRNRRVSSGPPIIITINLLNTLCNSSASSSINSNSSSSIGGGGGGGGGGGDSQCENCEKITGGLANMG